MTYSFIQAVQNEPGLTYGRLVNAMRYAIRDPKAGPLLNGPIASFVRKALRGAEISQVGFSCVIFVQLFLTHGSTWNNYKGGQFRPN